MPLEKIKIVMEEVTDAGELAQAQAQRARFDSNWDWFRQRSSDLYEHHRGECVVVAGQELFAAKTVEEALAQANTEHPEDDGRFIFYIPIEKVTRVYGYQR